MGEDVECEKRKGIKRLVVTTLKKRIKKMIIYQVRCIFYYTIFYCLQEIFKISTILRLVVTTMKKRI